jgi:hypothetical protein
MRPPYRQYTLSRQLSGSYNPSEHRKWHCGELLNLSYAMSIWSLIRNECGLSSISYSFCKAVPLQAWGGTEASRKLRSPDFLTKAWDGGKVVSPTHRLHLPPGNTPGTHFCWRLSRPQGHSAIRRIYVNEKFQWHHLESNPIGSDLYLNHCATAVSIFVMCDS